MVMYNDIVRGVYLDFVFFKDVMIYFVKVGKKVNLCQLCFVSLMMICFDLMDVRVRIEILKFSLFLRSVFCEDLVFYLVQGIFFFL